MFLTQAFCLQGKWQSVGGAVPFVASMSFDVVSCVRSLLPRATISESASRVSSVSVVESLSDSSYRIFSASSVIVSPLVKSGPAYNIPPITVTEAAIVRPSLMSRKTPCCANFRNVQDNLLSFISIALSYPLSPPALKHTLHLHQVSPRNYQNTHRIIRV